jgi:ATP-dependent Clp protease ATP-binding subunit ClpA
VVETKLIKTHKKQSTLPANWTELQDRLTELLKQTLKPELVNRFDEVVFFKPLESSELKQIVEIQLRHTRELLMAQNIDMVVTPKAIEKLAELSFDVEFGARPVRRVVQRYIQDELTDRLLSGEISSGHKLEVDHNGSDFTFTSIA